MRRAIIQMVLLRLPGLHFQPNISQLLTIGSAAPAGIACINTHVHKTTTNAVMWAIMRANIFSLNANTACLTLDKNRASGIMDSEIPAAGIMASEIPAAGIMDSEIIPLQVSPKLLHLPYLMCSVLLCGQPSTQHRRPVPA